MLIQFQAMIMYALPWIIQVVVVFLIAFVLTKLLKSLYNRLHNQALKSTKLWDDALLESLYKPLVMLVWLGVFVILYDTFQSHLQHLPLLKNVKFMYQVAAGGLIIYAALSFVAKLEENLANHSSSMKKIDLTSIRAIGKIARIAIGVVAFIVFLQVVMGVPLSGVIAFGGFGGLAVGYAAKDVLANFFGGLMVFTDRPFSIGDWISSPDKALEGTVEHIGWRQTRIRRFNQRPIYVPNSVFSSIVLENPSRMRNRQIDTKIGVRYQDAAKVDGICKDIKEYLMNHEGIDQNRTLFVYFDHFEESALSIRLYTFTKTTAWLEYLEIQHKIFIECVRIVESHGASCAFPTQTLHIEEGSLQ